MRRPSSAASSSSCRAERRFCTRLVVQRLGERLSLALLGRERVGEQPRALRRRAARRARVRRASRSRESRTHASPTQARKPACDEDEPSRLRLPQRGVGDRLSHVGGRRHDRRRGRDPGPETEGDRDRDEEEREPRVRERAAREDGEHADRGDVDARRQQRKPLARPAGVTQASMPDAPRREERERDRKPVSSRFGCDDPFAQRRSRAIAGRRSHATTRSVSAAASRRAGRATPHGYSIRPRRIALATAAARSETPSFS